MRCATGLPPWVASIRRVRSRAAAGHQVLADKARPVRGRPAKANWLGKRSWVRNVHASRGCGAGCEEGWRSKTQTASDFDLAGQVTIRARRPSFYLFSFKCGGLPGLLRLQWDLRPTCNFRARRAASGTTEASRARSHFNGSINYRLYDGSPVSLRLLPV